MKKLKITTFLSALLIIFWITMSVGATFNYLKTYDNVSRLNEVINKYEIATDILLEKAKEIEQIKLNKN